jgi:BirA family transcriptional regulator, biotin operon repressor / biotin---[acetyl-CoA-carboxylase] ligase
LAQRRPSFPAGTDLLWLEICGSTNDEARRQAASGARGPLWIVAERQTEGRGRQGRTWLSEPGNLTATYLCAPRLGPAEAAQLSFVAALAVADLVDGLSPGLATLKWPNDVLIRGRKVAGILLESAGGADGLVQWLAIGIGVNLTYHPEGTEFPATSFVAEGLAAPPLREAVARLARALDHWLAIHARDGFAPVRDAWLGRGPEPGARLTVRLGHEILAGTFAGLSEDGALMLRGADGELRRISAGEVFSDG